MVDNKELRGHIPRGLANAKTFGQICKDAGLGKAKENADKLDAEVGVANTEDGKVYVISNGHLVEALSQVPREDATQVVGEFIYAYIEQWAAQCGSKSVAPNLTGMLLEMDLGDLLHMTEDLNALNAKLYEAFIVLQKAGKVPPSASTSAVVHQKASARKERQRSARTWAKVDLRAEAAAFKHISGDWPTLPTEDLERAHYDAPRGKGGAGGGHEESDYESDYESGDECGGRPVVGDSLEGFEADVEFFEEAEEEIAEEEEEDLEKDRLLSALQTQSKRENVSASKAKAPVSAGRKTVANVRFKKKEDQAQETTEGESEPAEPSEVAKEEKREVDPSSGISSLIAELDSL